MVSTLKEANKFKGDQKGRKFIDSSNKENQKMDQYLSATLQNGFEGIESSLTPPLIDKQPTEIDFETAYFNPKFDQYLNQCYLKTQNLRFKQFRIIVEGNTMNFTRENKESKELKEMYSNSIEGAHIKLGEFDICQDTKVIYCPVVLLLPSGNKRIVYFETS